jgi:hypothetical protein
VCSSDLYLKVHQCTKKFIACKGSPRTGKSYVLIQKANQLLLDEDPYDKLKGQQPYLMWVIATSFKKVKDQLFPLYKQLAPHNRIKRSGEKTNSNEYFIEYDNGSRIVFKSQEEKIGEFKSADVHIVFADERIESQDIRENLRHRIITTDGRIFYTMDSLGEDEWLDEMEKLPYAEVFRFVLEDNKDYISKEEYQRLQTEGTNEQRERLLFGKPINENHKRIFLEDMWNESNYQPIEPKRGKIVDGEFIQGEGFLCVYREREEGKKYVVGYDSAAGTGGNGNALQIFSDDGEQIARVLNNSVHFTLWPEIIRDILNYYNKALFIPEVGITHSLYVVNTLAEKYFNIYMDEIVKNPSRYQKVDWGIRTNENNKKEMCDLTLADLNKCKLLLHDDKTIKQLEGFIEDYSGDTQKKNPKLHGTKIRDDEELRGSDDDLVMALFLADRALNKYNYFNIARRRKLPEEKKIKTIDDILNTKIIRFGGIQPKNYYSM